MGQFPLQQKCRSLSARSGVGSTGEVDASQKSVDNGIKVVLLRLWHGAGVEHGDDFQEERLARHSPATTP